MDRPVVCEECGAVLSAGSSVCEECGAGRAVGPSEAAATASPVVEVSARRPWWREIPGLRTNSLLERSLAVVGYPIVLALLLSAISGNWFAFILGLDILVIVVLAANAWGLRSRLPLFGSGSALKAAGGWFGLGAIAVAAIWGGLPQGLGLPAKPSAAPAPTATPSGTATGSPTVTAAKATPSAANLAALYAEIERNRKPTSPPPASGGTWAVGNTGGDGVALRKAPAASERLAIWRDGALMEAVGEDRQVDGRTWKNVRDPAGNVGWVPAEYLVAPRATPTPASSPANVQAALVDLAALTDRVNREVGAPFFVRAEARLGGSHLVVTVSDLWYDLPAHWKERALEMVADAYATIATTRNLRGAPSEANYPRTTFYDTFGKELAFKSAAETRVYR